MEAKEREKEGWINGKRVHKERVKEGEESEDTEEGG